MEVKNLMYILEAYKCLSINKAAQNVYLSQSRLSGIIRSIEAEVGYPIFLRTPSGLSVTQEGRLFLDDAEKILNSYKDIMEVPKRFERTEELSVCSTPSSSIFQYFLEFKELYPSNSSDVFLESGLRETIRKIVNRKCRIGILTMVENKTEKYSRLAEEYKLSFAILKKGIPMRIFMSEKHPLADREFLTPEDLAACTMLVDVNLDDDDRLPCNSNPQCALFVSDRGTSYDAIAHGNYLLAGLISPSCQKLLHCVSKPLLGGQNMALALVLSPLCPLNSREQRFISYLKAHVGEI